MKKSIIDKENEIRKYIKDNIGIVPSKRLVKLILNPSQIDQVRNDDLRDIVTECSPIEKYFRNKLDGKIEMQFISTFIIFLENRIRNKGELISIFNRTHDEEK